MKHNNENAMTVSADIGLFMYLQEKVCERKTKTEAYCNLLKKSSENFVSPILKGRNQTLGDHQCHVTITDLSIEWHWHRSTVRAFLEKLEEYGQIEITRLPKSFIITMPMQGNREDNNIGNNTSDIVQRLHPILSEWVSDKCATREAGERCVQTLRDDTTAFAESLADPCADNSEMSLKKDEHLNIVKQQLLESMAIASFQKTICESNKNSDEAIIAFFDNDLGGDSEAFLVASKVLAELLINGTSPALNSETPQTRAQFKNLLDSYKALLAQSFGHDGLL